MEEMVQVLLERKDGACSINMMCWLPAGPRVRVGKSITLDRDKKSWVVLNTYGHTRRADIKQLWKVGDLVEGKA